MQETKFSKLILLEETLILKLCILFYNIIQKKIQSESVSFSINMDSIRLNKSFYTFIFQRINISKI